MSARRPAAASAQPRRRNKCRRRTRPLRPDGTLLPGQQQSLRVVDNFRVDASRHNSRRIDGKYLFCAASSEPPGIQLIGRRQSERLVASRFAGRPTGLIGSRVCELDRHRSCFRATACRFASKKFQISQMNVASQAPQWSSLAASKSVCARQTDHLRRQVVRLICCESVGRSRKVTRPVDRPAGASRRRCL